MVITRTFLLAFAFLQGSLNTVFASEPLAAVDVSDLSNKPFLLEEELKVVLDGSLAASDIERRSTTYNRVTYLNKDSWRAYRSRPLQRNSKEYLKSQDQIFEMSPGNQRNKTLQSVTDRFWQEAVAAPVHYAREWTLIGSNDDWSDLLSMLKGAPDFTLKNADGDQMSASLKSDGSITLVSRGKILQDGKTSIQIESMWRLFQIGQVAEADLNRSLLRGHDQK